MSRPRLRAGVDSRHAPVGVVIVHWNQPGRCITTVDSFLAQGVAVEAVVVDNGSSAAAIAALRRDLPQQVAVIERGSNTGFGPAANAGLLWWLEAGTGDYVAVAPHDALPAADCLQLLIETFDDRRAVGFASADVGDGATPVVDPYFGGITRPASVHRGWEQADHPHGTLMMARRAALLDVGLFDERYFAYCEEADLGIRARRAGWEVGLVRGARVVNPTMRSGSAAVDYLMLRNTLLLVREHSGRYHAFIRFIIALGALAHGVIRPSARPELFSVRGRVRGLVDFLRGRYGPPPAGYFETLDASGDPV